MTTLSHHQTTTNPVHDKTYLDFWNSGFSRNKLKYRARARDRIELMSTWTIYHFVFIISFCTAFYVMFQVKCGFFPYHDVLTSLGATIYELRRTFKIKSKRRGVDYGNMGTSVRPLPAEQWARYSVLNVGLSKSVVMAAQKLCPWIPLSTIKLLISNIVTSIADWL